MLAREHIRCCIARLARGEDRRDAAYIAASYWPDSVTDYGVVKGTFDEYLAWVVPGADAISNTQHHIGQSHIELDGDSHAGQQAYDAARTACALSVHSCASPAPARAAQLDHLIRLTDELYPGLRLYFYDAHQVYSAPVTVFGPHLAVIYLGRTYLSFRDPARVAAISAHFDWLVREAPLGAREAGAPLRARRAGMAG